MKTPLYLHRNRYGKYYFRRAVPKHLQLLIGKREIVRSLNVNDYIFARKINFAMTILTEKLFQEVEKSLEHHDNNTLNYSIKFTLYPDGREEQVISVNPEDIVAMAECNMSPEEIASILKPSTSTPNFSTSTSRENSAKETEGTSLLSLVDRFTQHRIDEHGGNWKQPAGDITKLRRLCEILNSSSLITEITIETAEHVRRELSKLPANTASYRKMTFNQVINSTKDLDLKRISGKTINDHLELYSRLFKYAKSRRLIEIDPFDSVRVKHTDKTKAKEKRDLFTRDDLVKIFSSPLFTDRNKVAPYRYWAPIIGLYTGARRAEIAALYLSDIRQQDDIWVFDFNENSTDKKVKTANGIRLTPVHPQLVSFGILDYVKHLQSMGHDRLFPELSHWTNKEGYGRPIGDWFSDHLRKIGIHIPNKKVFHSFRHTISTELRREGADGLLIEQVCGRSTEMKSTGDLHYIKDDHLKSVYDALCRVDFSKELVNVTNFMNKSF